jgi:hypothetical protein
LIVPLRGDLGKVTSWRGVVRNRVRGW